METIIFSNCTNCVTFLICIFKEIRIYKGKNLKSKCKIGRQTIILEKVEISFFTVLLK